jgi:hypothetical protein
MYIQGIVYVHSLSGDDYISVTAARAFTLLGLMCGPKVMENVVVATTSKCKHMAESEQFSREAKLRGPTSPFKDYVDKVSFFSHTKGTLDSARAILTHALDKTRGPRVLLIQEEMNTGQKEFHETTRMCVKATCKSPCKHVEASITSPSEAQLGKIQYPLATKLSAMLINNPPFAVVSHPRWRSDINLMECE